MILMPEMQTAMTSLNFLSPDSKSQSFDHKANGYSRGEGAAVIVIKSLADAIRDGNTIRGVIRGTAVNQDGKTPGTHRDLVRLQRTSQLTQFKVSPYHRRRLRKNLSELHMPAQAWTLIPPSTLKLTEQVKES